MTSIPNTALLTDLLRQSGLPSLELPYTDVFEHIYADFIRQTGVDADRHDVWRQIIELRLAASTASEVKDAVALPAAPASAVALPSAGMGVSASSAAAMAQAQLTLFQPAIQPQQPWCLAPQPPADGGLAQEREKLLAALAQSELGTMEQKVAHILQRYPETRDSDTALAIRYWTLFRPEVLEKWDRLNLEVLYDLDRLDTISRIRRHIQNDLRLFAALAHTRQQRGLLQMEFHEYVVAHRATPPDIRFYLDETGNDGQKAYLGVAGVCVMNWRQYEKHWASLTQWRQAQAWPATIHFTDADAETRPRALSLLSALHQRRSGLLFVGYALPSRGQTQLDLLSLFVQLVVDTLHHMDQLGCLPEPRVVRVIKEADAGFDSQYMKPMDRDLTHMIAQEFPDRIAVDPTEALPKGREVMLECADLIAGAMRRRALYGGRNPKDALAEAVFNVTGFEDPRDNGTVLKGYPA